MGTGRHGQYIDVIASPLPGSPFDPSTMLNKALCNVIASLIFARRFEYGDPYLIRMLDLLEESLTGRWSREAGRATSVLCILPEGAAYPGRGEAL